LLGCAGHISHIAQINQASSELCHDWLIPSSELVFLHFPLEKEDQAASF
jgi:hypothetical protein